MLTKSSFFSSLLKKNQKAIILKGSLLFTIGLSLTFAISACSSNSVNPTNTPNDSQSNKSNVVRIGYQKSSTVLYVPG